MTTATRSSRRPGVPRTLRRWPPGASVHARADRRRSVSLDTADRGRAGRARLRARRLPDLDARAAASRGAPGRRRRHARLRRRGDSRGGSSARAPHGRPRSRCSPSRSPFEVSQAYGVETVPTAVRIDPGAGVTGPSSAGTPTRYARLLGHAAPRRGAAPQARLRRALDVRARAGGLDELEDMIERGWSDGLPVVPPTPERVEAMLGGRDPALSLGPVPPAHGEATFERARGVCGPRRVPARLLPRRASLQPRLRSSPASTRTESRSRPSPPGPILVVNGPVRETARDQQRHGRARARHPGQHDHRPRAALAAHARRAAPAQAVSTAPRSGTRASSARCFAENEEASPWEPLHVERGFSRDVSTVTLFAGDAPLSISDHRSRTPEELAATLAWAAAGHWSPFWWPMDDTSLFVLCPEHATLFAAAGWSKDRVRAAMFDAVQRPAGELRRGETTAFVQGERRRRPRAKVDAIRSRSRSSSPAERQAASRPSSARATGCRPRP